MVLGGLSLRSGAKMSAESGCVCDSEYVGVFDVAPKKLVPQITALEIEWGQYITGVCRDRQICFYGIDVSIGGSIAGRKNVGKLPINLFDCCAGSVSNYLTTDNGEQI